MVGQVARSPRRGSMLFSPPVEERTRAMTDNQEPVEIALCISFSEPTMGRYVRRQEAKPRDIGLGMRDEAKDESLSWRPPPNGPASIVFCWNIDKIGRNKNLPMMVMSPISPSENSLCFLWCWAPLLLPALHRETIAALALQYFHPWVISQASFFSSWRVGQ